MAHILVAGLGDLGQAVAERWLAAGHRVSGVRRGAAAPAGVELYSQTLGQEPVQLPDGQIDLLYFILTPSRRDEDSYRAAFLDAPAALLDALQLRQPLPPVVFVSSTAVYGDHDGTVDEDSEPRPTAFNARILLAAEQELSFRALTTVVRFSGIYGPGRERLVRQVAAIRAGAAAPSPQWSNCIHRDDCVGLLMQVGQGWLAGEMQWPVVVGTDQEPALNVAVLNWIAAQHGDGLALAEPEQAPGRRVCSRYIGDGHYRLQYPGYRDGYAAPASASITQSP